MTTERIILLSECVALKSVGASKHSFASGTDSGIEFSFFLKKWYKRLEITELVTWRSSWICPLKWIDLWITLLHGEARAGWKSQHSAGKATDIPLLSKKYFGPKLWTSDILYSKSIENYIYKHAANLLLFRHNHQNKYILWQPWKLWESVSFTILLLLLNIRTLIS